MLRDLLKQSPLHKGFKNKGRRVGEEIEGIPLPMEYDKEFKVKDVRFFYE